MQLIKQSWLLAPLIWFTYNVAPSKPLSQVCTCLSLRKHGPHAAKTKAATARWNNRQRKPYHGELLSQQHFWKIQSQCECRHNQHLSRLKVIASRKSIRGAREATFQVFLSVAHDVHVSWWRWVWHKGRQRKKERDGNKPKPSCVTFPILVWKVAAWLWIKPSEAPEVERGTRHRRMHF